MNEPKTLEVQLLGWAKSTSKNPPRVTFALARDEDCEFFEAFTVAKNKTAGQLFDIAIQLSCQDDQNQGSLFADEPSVVAHAVMLCKDPDFQDFAYRRMGAFEEDNKGEALAAECIRGECGIASRSELRGDPAARERFYRLLDLFDESRRETHA